MDYLLEKKINTATNANDLFNVADDIFHRLADHKFFLNGELKYFVREFEEKRNDREDSQLENSKLNFESLVNKGTGEVEQRLKENNFDNILLKLNALSESFTALLHIESKSEEARKQSLAEKIETHSKVKDNLLNQFNSQKLEYDQMCKTQEEELKKRYRDLELKWKASDTS